MDRFPRVGIGVFVIKNHKFLMGCRKNSHGDGSWSVPGGHLEFGEKVEVGAAREMFEETGVRIRNIRIVGITNDIFKKENKHYITIWLFCRWKRGKERITEPDKFIDQGWFDFKSLPKPLFLPWKQLFKSDFLKDIRAEVSKN
jgi:8-oxo-dGTP diphosphatase